ncbi:hypothetical protein [Lactiplantibacillus modestisalitolerans]|uniref:Gram-positive cocci surface proteins LPxTG domain-containing protein n=1 Tax=Lactiplantibacillus modestisalitolerans TaxID=1457219 RepID=A0ABV5WWQ9_9LACO|nr:hypothetical protein [Lactiplantibacillus modestisalitolerans]
MNDSGSDYLGAADQSTTSLPIASSSQPAGHPDTMLAVKQSIKLPQTRTSTGSGITLLGVVLSLLTFGWFGVYAKRRHS